MHERIISKKREVKDFLMVAGSGLTISLIDSIVEKGFIPDNVGKVGALAAIAAGARLVFLLNPRIKSPR